MWKKRKFTEKLIRHVHEKNNHLHIAWRIWEKTDGYHIYKVQSRKWAGVAMFARLFPPNHMKELLQQIYLSFEQRWVDHSSSAVDFKGPLYYKVRKKKKAKAYITVFTRAVSRAVHLEVTRSPTAEEFQQKLNAFITRRTRPERIVPEPYCV